MKEHPKEEPASAIEADSVVDINTGSRELLAAKMLRALPLNELDVVELTSACEGYGDKWSINSERLFPAGTIATIVDIYSPEHMLVEIVDDEGNGGWSDVSPESFKVVHKHFPDNIESRFSAGDAIELTTTITGYEELFDLGHDIVFPPGTKATIVDDSDPDRLWAQVMDEHGHVGWFYASSEDIRKHSDQNESLVDTASPLPSELKVGQIVHLKVDSRGYEDDYGFYEAVARAGTEGRITMFYTDGSFHCETLDANHPVKCFDAKAEDVVLTETS